MEANTSSAPSSFLDNLKWVRCSFCMQQFTRDGKFFVLSCCKVACINCATKMISKTEEKVIDCALCKKMVRACQIREEMPENIQNYLKSPQTFVAHVSDYEKRQKHLHETTVQNMRSKHMRVMEEGRLRITDYEKATEKNRNTPYREQVLRIILENNLQKLLVLNEEQLQRMDISQIRGTTYPSLHGRRHSLPSPSHHSNDLWGQLDDRRLESQGLNRGNTVHHRNTTASRRKSHDLSFRNYTRD